MKNIELDPKQSLKPKISFIDLKAQQQPIRNKIEAAIAKVLDHGGYIMGPEVAELEQKLSAFCGVKYTITCANGTDALALGLMAKGVGPNDAIIVPTFTFAATAEVVAWMGAVPIFVDVLPDTYNIDPDSIERGIQTAKELGLKVRGIIPVDLFGQPADYDAIQTIADKNDLWIIADGAQSFGAFYKGKRVGNIGDIATTSFFPAKPLGCYGDGGAVFTNDEKIVSVIKSLRVHGQGADKYDNVRIGMNGRLDTLQAAILIEKLAIFSEEIVKRDAIAKYYNKGLSGVVEVPKVMEKVTSVWAQYTVRLPKGTDREKLILNLNKMNVPTMVYYVKPLHLQVAYKHYPTAGQKELPVSKQLSEQVLSLPMHAYLKNEELDIIIEQLRDCL